MSSSTHLEPMTTLFSSHQRYPTSLEHPTTPQSPSGYMTRDHVGAKFSMNDSRTCIVSPTIDSTLSTKHSSSGIHTIPTPASVPPTTVHDLEGNMDSDNFDVDNLEFTLKHSGKRRGSISAEEAHDIYNHPKRTRSIDVGMNEATMLDAPPATAAAVPSLQEILAQTDVHPLHLLCQQTYAPLYPRPTTSIFPLYNLTSIAESVARQDPVTRAKKKLRKSYKGKIMDLPGRPEIPKTATRPAEGEAGVDESAPAPKNRSMGLLEMLDWPEEEWRAQKEIGKEITQGLSPDMLRRALTMSTGPIPGFDPSILGLDDNKKPQSSSLSTARATQTPSASIATPAQHLPNGSTPGGNISSASASPLVLNNDRSQRTRKNKRRYDDNSFEGYGEGYEDDDGGEDGGGGGGEVRKKKKKKKSDVGTPGGLTAPNVSYGSR